MCIWELHFAGLNQYAVLVPSAVGLNVREIFSANGKAKHWDIMPKVQPDIEKRKKKALPRADISYLIGGAIVINEKAYQALKDFLLPFGQLLPLDCLGEVEYFYNVTNIISCIDYERSEKQFDVVFKEVFLPDVLPETPVIFKDPLTVRISIYVNQAAKEKFEELAASAGLIGARFVEAGQGLI